MALNVNDFYVFTQKLIRKNQSGSLSATEFNVFWNEAQRAYMGDLLGRFQARSNGKTGANTGLILNETLLTKLAPFTKEDTLTIAAGEATAPADMLYRLALMVGEHDVYFVNNGQVASVQKSVIDPPSIDNNRYYAYQIENKYVFLPIATPTAKISYISDVTDVLWAFTLDVNNRQVYDPGTSVQSQWDDVSNMEITKRMLQQIGVSFKDRDFQNFGTQNILTGD